MEIKVRWGYFNQIVIVFLIVQGCFADCNSPSNSLNREVTIDSWTGNWTFEGVEVATGSNDYFYLLSSADDNQCGIIRENVSGEVIWARTYSNGQCSGLTLNSDKTWLFFSSAYNTDYYALGKVNPIDGNLSSYLAVSELTLAGKATNMHSIYGPEGEIIEILGNITTSSSTNLRIWFSPVYNGLAYFGPFDCAQFFNEFSDFTDFDPLDCADTTSGLSFVLDSNFFSSRYGFDVFLTNETQIQLYVVDTSQNDTSADWVRNIVCISTCPAADYTRSDFDETNIHFAANFPSEAQVLIMVLAVSNGDLVGTMKTTQSSQQMALASLSADSNSITWISAYSTSSAYSELIKFDSANNNFTVYQQSGISYVFQHIDSSNNNWFALGVTRYITNSTQVCMSDIDGLSVSTSTSGLDEASSFNLASVDPYEIECDLYPLNINTSITSTASHTNYALVVVRSQTNEDGLSNSQLVNITISSLFGLSCILAITIAIRFIIRKRSNRYDGRQEVSTEVQREDHHEQNLDSQQNEDNDNQHFEIEESKHDQDDASANQNGQYDVPDNQV